MGSLCSPLQLLDHFINCKMNTMNFKNNSIKSKKSEIKSILMTISNLSPYAVSQYFNGTGYQASSILMHDGDILVHIVDYKNNMVYSTFLNNLQDGKFYEYRGAKVKQKLIYR